MNDPGQSIAGPGRGGSVHNGLRSLILAATPLAIILGWVVLYAEVRDSVAMMAKTSARLVALEEARTSQSVTEQTLNKIILRIDQIDTALDRMSARLEHQPHDAGSHPGAPATDRVTIDIGVEDPRRFPDLHADLKREVQSARRQSASSEDRQ